MPWTARGSSPVHTDLHEPDGRSRPGCRDRVHRADHEVVRRPADEGDSRPAGGRDEPDAPADRRTRATRTTIRPTRPTATRRPARLQLERDARSRSRAAGLLGLALPGGPPGDRGPLRSEALSSTTLSTRRGRNRDWKTAFGGCGGLGADRLVSTHRSRARPGGQSKSRAWRSSRRTASPRSAGTRWQARPTTRSSGPRQRDDEPIGVPAMVGVWRPNRTVTPGSPTFADAGSTRRSLRWRVRAHRSGRTVFGTGVRARRCRHGATRVSGRRPAHAVGGDPGGAVHQRRERVRVHRRPRQRQ